MNLPVLQWFVYHYAENYLLFLGVSLKSISNYNGLDIVWRTLSPHRLKMKILDFSATNEQGNPTFLMSEPLKMNWLTDYYMVIMGSLLKKIFF